MPEHDRGGAVQASAPARRYVMNGALVIEQRTESHVTLLDTDTSQRTRVSVQAYRLLLRFGAAGSAEEALGDGGAERAGAAVEGLLARGLLQDADTPPARRSRRRTPVAYRFCNASAWQPGAACDFVVLGAPHDMAGEVECRLAPAHVRQKSLDQPYRLDIHTAEPLGWFDTASAGWILQGIRFSDAGDVPVDHAAAEAAARDAILGALDEVCAGGAVPVVLGGDVTSAAAAMAWCASQGPTIAVIVGAGLVGGTPMVAELDTLRRAGAAAVCVARDSAHVQGACGDAARVLLSIDAAALHACYVSGPTAAPLLRLDTMREVIAAVARRGRVVAIQLGGWPAGGAASDVTSAAACDLLLHAMDAARPMGRP